MATIVKSRELPREYAVKMFHRYGGIRKSEIHQSLKKKGYDIPYNTVCSWLPKTKVRHTESYSEYEW